MKYLAYFLFISLIISSCSTRHNLTGIWTETWKGTGEVSDVDDVDTLHITVSTNNRLSIKCLSSKDYTYDRIHFRNNSLKFRMRNISDSSEAFFVYYKLKLTADSLLAGPIRNIKNQTDSVFLKRL